MELWVDILTQEEAKLYPPIDITPPPMEKYEVRVIIWKAKEMVSMDTVTDAD